MIQNRIAFVEDEEMMTSLYDNVALPGHCDTIVIMSWFEMDLVRRFENLVDGLDFSCCPSTRSAWIIDPHVLECIKRLRQQVEQRNVWNDGNLVDCKPEQALGGRGPVLRA